VEMDSIVLRIAVRFSHLVVSKLTYPLTVLYCQNTLTRAPIVHRPCCLGGCSVVPGQGEEIGISHEVAD
jgi:hypothetical protein